MPCQPICSGPAKGVVVREIEQLGEMGAASVKRIFKCVC